MLWSADAQNLFGCNSCSAAGTCSETNKPLPLWRRGSKSRVFKLIISWQRVRKVSDSTHVQPRVRVTLFQRRRLKDKAGGVSDVSATPASIKLGQNRGPQTWTAAQTVIKESRNGTSYWHGQYTTQVEFMKSPQAMSLRSVRVLPPPEHVPKGIRSV